ncbi:hypothetical protein KEJ18_02725 [Candidatus Bathyarchaeota archaeon]|nr:hypothetical protein [Candidatus Bathyarchaeota archaeon]
MSRNERINIQALIRKARSNDHHEAYVNLERNQNCRIGVVARTAPLESQLFIEILVYLPSFGKVDLQDLKRKVVLLEELQKRKYFLTYQEGNLVVCEAKVSANNVKEEYEAIKKLTRKVFST